MRLAPIGPDRSGMAGVPLATPLERGGTAGGAGEGTLPGVPHALLVADLDASDDGPTPTLERLAETPGVADRSVESEIAFAVIPPATKS